MKSNSVMSRSVVGTVIAWTFRDGKSVSIDVSTLTPELKELGLIHGISQKVADSAAMSVNTETGLPASVDDKRAAMEKVIATLNGGEWSGAREGGDGGGLLFSALCAVYPKKTPDAIRAYMKPLTAAQKASLAETKRVKHEIDKIRAARVKAAGIDEAELIAGLNAIPDVESVE